MTHNSINKTKNTPNSSFQKIISQGLTVVSVNNFFPSFIAMIISVLLAFILPYVTGDFYSSRYDDFDVQPLIENDRILLSYTKCFLDQGPCTPDAKDFKKVIPETIETTCGKCTLKQRQLMRKVIRAVKERHPEAWDQIFKKYDAEHKYKDSFDQFVLNAD